MASPAPESDDRVALVLDAGGARSAYQVGALQELLPELAARGQRPRVLLGTSAGALLTGALAATAHLPAEQQAERLMDVLGSATKTQVMDPIWRQGPAVVLRYVSETVGLKGFRLRGFVGTGPLARTLGRAIGWDALHANVAEGLVDAVGVTATGVRSGRVVTFTETAPGTRLPSLPVAQGRSYVDTRLGVDHLLASAAIPALFPSVHVTEPDEASGWYVDGATRRRVPLAPALELGADRVVAVGTGSIRAMDPDRRRDNELVDLGDSGATLLGAVMDDPLRHDLRRLAEVNLMAADPDLAPHLDRHRTAHGLPPYRAVPYVAVSPHQGDELSDLAMDVFRSNHGSIRRTLGDPDLQLVHRLLGSDSPLQGELLSYLLFDPDFFTAAAELGRREAREWLEANPGLWRTEPF